MGYNIWIEIAGWTGAVLILAAYALVSAGRVSGRSVTYQYMNIVGATGFILNGWWHGALPSVALNVIWLMIGTLALCRVIFYPGQDLEPPKAPAPKN